MPVVLSSKAYSVYPVSFHDLNFPFELPEDSLIINSCSNGIKTSQDLQNEKNQQNQQNQQSLLNQQDQPTPSSLSIEGKGLGSKCLQLPIRALRLWLMKIHLWSSLE